MPEVKRVPLYLPPSMADKLDEQSKILHISRNTLIVQCIANGLPIIERSGKPLFEYYDYGKKSEIKK